MFCSSSKRNKEPAMSEDSEKQTEGKPEKTPAPSEQMILHHESHTPVKVFRNEKGKFVRSPKTMPKTADVTRLMRNLLNAPVTGEKSSESRFREMFDNIVLIASTSPHQPVLDKLGHPIRLADGSYLTVMDAKCAMASVQAFKELSLRAYGAPSKSEEEIEAMQTQGVKIVVLTPPEFMINKQITEEKPREKLTPSFIEAEIVDNK
jgi:hypothetical protein